MIKIATDNDQSITKLVSNDDNILHCCINFGLFVNIYYSKEYSSFGVTLSKKPHALTNFGATKPSSESK